MGKPDAPEPPDPKETAAGQTGTSVSTALANTIMGNVNRVGPDGSTLTYDQTGSYSFTDPYTGQTYDLPTFTATESLSPEARAIYDTGIETQGNLGTLARDQSAFLKDYMAEPFTYGVGEYEQWAGDTYDRLSGSALTRQQQQREAQLANQGLVPGSEAYDAAMKSLYEGQQGARDQFMLDAYGTGMQTALTQRNQPINEISALLSGSQVSMPSFSINQPSAIPTTDVAGLIETNYNQQLGKYQQEMANSQSILGGLFGLGSGALMGGFGPASWFGGRR